MSADTIADTDVRWLPTGWAHPMHVTVGQAHHLRPIRAADVDLYVLAVHGSRDRLWSMYGRAWGWPPAGTTSEQDAKDLARQEAEIAAHESFNYALFNNAESEVVGCVYVDPPAKVGADAEVSWWVVDEMVGTELEVELNSVVPEWIASTWPLERPRYVGRDVTWDEWLGLPELPTWSAARA